MTTTWGVNRIGEIVRIVEQEPGLMRVVSHGALFGELRVYIRAALPYGSTTELAKKFLLTVFVIRNGNRR